MLHLYTTADQENYLKLVRPLAPGVHIQRSMQSPITFTQVHMPAKQQRAAVVVCNPTLLKLLIHKVEGGGADSYSLSDYAGSLINHDGVDYLVCNPPEHIITTSEGRFLWHRYLSKLVQPSRWPAQPVFRWSLATPESIESLYQRHIVDCDLIAMDIETVSEPANAITCCVFSAVTFRPDTNGCPYTIQNIVLPIAYAEKGQHEFMLSWLRKLSATKQPKILQNGKYDNAWLIYYHSPVTNWLFDTINMFHSWFSELPKRLDFIAAFTEREVTFWKNEKNGNRESYFRYNARDGYNTAIACINILNEWPDWARRNFEAEFPLVFPCILAELTGIKGDRSRFEAMRVHTSALLASQRAELEILTAAPGFNPNSPPQVAKLIEVLGGSSAKGTGKIARDSIAAAHPLNKFLLTKIGKYRETQKLLSSYLKPKILTVGDRILYVLNPHGTDTGRLASKESHFWCGLQIQNIPRDRDDAEFNVKEFFVADEGFYLGECDRKQAESYGTAYITGDEGLLAAVNGDKDFHGLNASRFFGVSYEAIVDSQGKTLDKPLRDLSKRTNHGANYMMMAQVLLDTMGIEKTIQARKLLKLPSNWSLLQVTTHLLACFEQTYPTVRGPFAEWIKNTVKATKMLVGATGWTRYCFDNPDNKRAWNSYVAHNAQSLNAQELNRGWLRVFNEIALPNPKDFKLCAQIHDSILFQYRIGRIDLAWKVKECMENPLEVTDFRGNKRTMLIPSDLSGEATRWSDTKKLTPMNLIQHYLAYVEQTEPMYVYHRWTLFSIAGALLGRRLYLKHGHFNVFPNMYCMFIGEPGSRKSTAIKIGGKVVKLAGYESDATKFAATKSTKEKFLLDLEGAPDEPEFIPGRGRKIPKDNIGSYEDLSASIFGNESSTTQARECFVVADEFNEFIGIRNIEFISLLGTLWDWDDDTKPFESRIKTGRSAKVFQPTISILGGNTHDNFNTAFPPEILGQGFFSRLLLIYGEKSDRRFTIPPQPTEEQTAAIVQHLASLKSLSGVVEISPQAMSSLDTIYKTWQDLPDSRFLSYSNRRFTHFLKLCIIVASLQQARRSDGTFEITQEVVIAANTYLTSAEILMPKALGEFGRGKNSSVINKIIEILKAKDLPMNAQDLWKETRRDLNKILELVDILNGMVSANVIFHIPHKGYMLKPQQKKEFSLVDWDLLTSEELRLISS